jgi:hypothetical protein
MRSRFAHAAVFIGVFCLFTGYCKWWSSRVETHFRATAGSSRDRGAVMVSGAGDDTFNGIYVGVSVDEGGPCYVKRSPYRCLWPGASCWRLSTESGLLADGYMTDADSPITGEWRVDGACKPAPRVHVLSVALEQHEPD